VRLAGQVLALVGPRELLLETSLQVLRVPLLSMPLRRYEYSMRPLVEIRFVTLRVRQGTAKVNLSNLDDQQLVRYLQEQEDQKKRERYEKYMKKQMIVEKEHKFWSTQVG
jgi:predicted nucleotidyltransferase